MEILAFFYNVGFAVQTEWARLNIPVNCRQKDLPSTCLSPDKAKNQIPFQGWHPRQLPSSSTGTVAMFGTGGS